MKNMKKLIGDSPAIFSGDNQFQAALSMVARSRSPLPPSPTGSTPLLDADLCPMSSVKPLMPIPVEPSRSLKPPPPLKPKPTKPPRKNLPVVRPDESSENGKEHHSQNSNFDDSADYDDIEVRNDAWKTMGVGIMPHSERPFLHRLQETAELPRNGWQQPEEHFYDKLQHLGPTSKLHPKPGYRQITAIAPPVPSANTLPTTAELVPDMQPVRAADDSHLGYGVIRKKSMPVEENLQVSGGPPHQVYNDQEYALVCKPNRV